MNEYPNTNVNDERKKKKKTDQSRTWKKNWNFQVLISQKESGINWKKFLGIFDWSNIN